MVSLKHNLCWLVAALLALATVGDVPRDTTSQGTGLSPQESDRHTLAEPADSAPRYYRSECEPRPSYSGRGYDAEIADLVLFVASPPSRARQHLSRRYAVGPSRRTLHDQGIRLQL